MATLQINLPEPTRAAAQAQAQAGGFSSIDEYLAHLIESDKLLPLTPELEAALLEGLDSGPAVEVTPQFYQDLKQRVRSQGRSGVA